MTNRKHYFTDEHDNHTVVITTLLPTGEYGAYREDEDEGRYRGFGHSRFAAIADLQEWIEDQKDEEEGSEVPGFDDATRNDEYFRP